MQTGIQTHIAFHLGGMRPGGKLDTLDGLRLRPALFAGYRDLDKLRYDYPLVLVRDGVGAQAVQPLSAIMDAATQDLGSGPDADRVRSHALRLEREIRGLVTAHSGPDLSALWNTAAERMLAENAGEFRDSLARLRAAVKTDGAVVGCDEVTPFRLCHHYWQTVQAQKAKRFREGVGPLAMKLADILRADFVRSPEGLSPDKLEAAMGGAHRDLFDFGALSQLLSRTTSRTSLSESRRRRIRWLLSVLETQRFYPPLMEGDEHFEPYNFVFPDCMDAMSAYRDRLPQMVELSKAIAIAGLEIAGEYDEARHDPLFAGYGIDHVDEAYFELLPDYLILLQTTDTRFTEAEAVLNAFASGMRAKVLVQTDDILELPAFIGGNILPALRSKQFVNAAIGLGDFYVLQSPASNLAQFADELFRGFSYPGAALFSVFSGASGDSLPPYLCAAAALESRAFPAFTYDPLAGDDWPSRFRLDGTPQAARDWPSYPLNYEDAGHQRAREDVAFTLADFVACDRRYFSHFARVPREQWGPELVPLADFLDLKPGETSGKVPYLLMVDDNDVLQKVIADDKIVQSTRRSREMWHSQQELSGLRGGRMKAAPVTERAADVAPAEQPPARVNGYAAPEAAAPAPERSPADAYIETARCSSCNRCVRINAKMFAYDANMQAYIKDPDAGTYRQLVAAAEDCQLSIIHPGLPRNPAEPGLDELVRRAELFL